MDATKYRKIIAVDFDGCLAMNRWPDIGDPIEKNIQKLKDEQNDGAQIILWTCREGSKLDAAINWCMAHGIIFDAVNENVPQIVESFGTDCRKIFANEYWDDRAMVVSEKDIGEFTDGYHSFNDLYQQRLILSAALFNAHKKLAWKSRLHADGKEPFGGGWFIVGIQTPVGQYSYHYENEHWELFDVPEICMAPEWDGHTSEDVTRLISLSLTDTEDANILSWAKTENIKQRRIFGMFKRSCEDPSTLYVCLFGRRYIFRNGKYDGWYRP